MSTTRDLRFRGKVLVLRRCTTIAVGLAVIGCGPTKRPEPDTTAIPLQESPGALASRHECQASLDAARSALVRQDADACLANLARAATFFRAEAESAPVDARTDLRASAEELETLVANIARSRPRTPRDFDRVFTRANAAEAALHLGRARIAMIENDHVRAGEELLMATDHLERAVKDARLRGDSVVASAIANTKSLASEMVRGMAAVPDEQRRVSDDIEAAIARIVAHVYVAPGPRFPPT